MTQPAATDCPVRVSASAAKRISVILQKRPDARALRVAVDGGGCSGFSYRFEFAGDPEPDDLIIERDGVFVYIDEVSVPFLEGAEIDFAEELIGSAFRINNPNATASCGCGTSFSIG